MSKARINFDSICKFLNNSAFTNLILSKQNLMNVSQITQESNLILCALNLREFWVNLYGPLLSTDLINFIWNDLDILPSELIIFYGPRVNEMRLTLFVSWLFSDHDTR
jgi:hypothetical protein